MPYFRVRVLGSGVRAEVDGNPQVLGFHVTREVEAVGISDAVGVASRQVADELSGSFPAENLFGLVLEAEEVAEIERFDGEAGTGFVWFEEGDSNDPKLFSCLIEEADPLRPYFQMYWAYGDELGEALESMVAAAALNGLRRPRCKQADPFDPTLLKEDLISSADGRTRWSPTRHFFPPTVGFTPPYGVIASAVEGPFDLADIRVGYSRSEADGLICIETNTLENDLLANYLSLIRALEPLRVFWVKLHDHWPPQLAEQILVNEHITTADQVDEFVKASSRSILRNGFVSITGYLDDGATNVSITDHKKLEVLTYSPAMADQVVGLFRQIGYGEIDPFLTIDQEFHHWHYRDPAGADYWRLVSDLMIAGFDPWSPGEH